MEIVNGGEAGGFDFILEICPVKSLMPARLASNPSVTLEEIFF